MNDRILNYRQLKFVENYRVTRNGAESARKAGYSDQAFVKALLDKALGRMTK